MNAHPLIEKFLTYLRVEKGVSPRTLETYLYPLKALHQFAAKNSLELESMAEDDILTFLTDRKDSGVSSATMFLTALCLRLFYRFLAKHERTDRDPTLNLSLPKVEGSIPNPLAFSDLEKLLAEPSTDKFSVLRTHLLVELAYQSGLRASELTNLHLGQINLDEGWLKVEHSKNRRQRIVPLGPKVIEKLRYYLEARTKRFPHAGEHLFLSTKGKPLDRKTFWWLLKQLARRVGIKGRVSPHQLRHSFCTHLLWGGSSLRDIQELAGWKNLEMAQRYVHLDLNRLRNTIKNHPRFS